MPAAPRPTQPAAAPAGEERRSWPALFVIVLVIAIPVSIVGGLHWLDSIAAWNEPEDIDPQWVPSNEVRATTRDGTLVKLHVAFDVRNRATRAAVEREVRELGLLLELSISSISTPELTAPDGISRLSAAMLSRVNDYLASQGVHPMRSVAIQDIWYTRP